MQSEVDWKESKWYTMSGGQKCIDWKNIEIKIYGEDYDTRN